MEFLPTTLGTRPRLAVEVRAEGIVAARAEDAAALLVAVSRISLGEGAIVPGLKPGNVLDRPGVVSALRKTLEAVAEGTNGRGREVTLIVPDASVRVLLLDFDSLPAKAVEALPVVRFRLKKMLPFEAEDAAISYQVMSSTRSGVRVVAAAMPREVLTEYEAIVRDAGFEPGGVLPSTLAVLAGLDVSETAMLVINAGPQGVTTAIVEGGVLLLHRSVDMTTEEIHVEPIVSLPPTLLPPATLSSVSLPLIDRDASIEEWALQQPAPLGPSAEAAREATQSEPNAVLAGVREELRELALTSGSREVTQAVSVAAAYFEDTLGLLPGTILSAGTTGAERLAHMLRDAGFGSGQELRVREIVEPAMIGSTVTANVACGWLAGVRGALKS